MSVAVSGSHALATDDFDRVILTGKIKVRPEATYYWLGPGPEPRLRTDLRFATPPPLYGNVPDPLVRNAVVADNAGPANMAGAIRQQAPGSSRSPDRRSASIASSRSMSVSSNGTSSQAQSLYRSPSNRNPGSHSRSRSRPRSVNSPGDHPQTPLPGQSPHRQPHAVRAMNQPTAGAGLSPDGSRGRDRSPRAPEPAGPHSELRRSNRQAENQRRRSRSPRLSP